MKRAAWRCPASTRSGIRRARSSRAISDAKNQPQGRPRTCARPTTRVDEAVARGLPTATSARCAARTRWTSTTCSCAPSTLFERNARGAAQRYRRRFRYVLVDEYQDTNRAQYRAAARCSPRRSATSWSSATTTSRSTAGAAPTSRNILDFEQDFPGAQVVQLEQNYRSTQTILDAANAVIAKQPRTARTKKLWTRTRRGRADPLLAAATSARRRGASRRDPARCARGPVASRDRHLLPHQRAVPRAGGALRAAGVPYRVVGGPRFYERAEIKDAARLPARARATRPTRSACARMRRRQARRGPGGDRQARGLRRGAGHPPWARRCRSPTRPPACRPTSAPPSPRSRP